MLGQKVSCLKANLKDAQIRKGTYFLICFLCCLWAEIGEQAGQNSPAGPSDEIPMVLYYQVEGWEFNKAFRTYLLFTVVRFPNN